MIWGICSGETPDYRSPPSFSLFLDDLFCKINIYIEKLLKNFICPAEIANPVAMRPRCRALIADLLHSRLKFSMPDHHARRFRVRQMNRNTHHINGHISCGTPPRYAFTPESMDHGGL